MFLRKIACTAFVLGGAAGALFISGCAGVAHVATASAEAEQKPPVSNYSSGQAVNRVFTGAIKAMGLFGQVLNSDRESGTIQGQKGNWVMNVSITEAKPGAKIALSLRYVPGQRMDFHSREGLTADYLSKLQGALSEKLTQIE